MARYGDGTGELEGLRLRKGGFKQIVASLDGRRILECVSALVVSKVVPV